MVWCTTYGEKISIVSNQSFIIAVTLEAYVGVYLHSKMLKYATQLFDYASVQVKCSSIGYKWTLLSSVAEP